MKSISIFEYSINLYFLKLRDKKKSQEYNAKLLLLLTAGVINRLKYFKQEESNKVTALDVFIWLAAQSEFMK